MSEDMIILRRFMETEEAEIAKGLLVSEGIHAVVVPGASHDPILNTALSTVLRVRQRDEKRADELLRASEIDDTDPDVLDGEDDVTRCQSCELEFCYYGYPRGFGKIPGLAIMMSVVHRLTSRAQWRCTKCNYVWEDADEGPRVPSQFAADDPRPTFLLQRDRKGLGLFLGFVGGYFATIGLGPAYGGVMLIGPIGGFMLGKLARHYVCSNRSCRERLSRGHQTCPKCERTIAGTVTSVAQHYAETAEIRRDFEAIRKKEARAKRRKRRARRRAAS